MPSQQAPCALSLINYMSRYWLSESQVRTGASSQARILIVVSKEAVISVVNVS